MMRRGILLGLGLVLAAPSVQAGWDFRNPSYATFATQADLDAVSGLSGSEPIAIAIDNDGSLLVIDDPVSTVGKLIDLDLGGGDHGTVVLNESALTTATPDPADDDLDVDRILVAPDGTLYIGEHLGDDDLLAVDPTRGPLGVSSLAVLNGLQDIALDPTANRLYVTLEADFGAAADGILMVDLSDRSISTAATAAQIRTATAGANACLNTCVVLPNGNLAFFDEAFYGGTDGIFALESPGPSPLVSLLRDTSFFPSAPGFVSLIATPEGDLLGWNQVPASGAPNLTIIPHDAASSEDVIEIPVDEIKSGVGLPAATGFRPDNQGSLALKVMPGAPGRLLLFLAESRYQQSIYTMTFTEVPKVDVVDWPLF